MSEQYDIPHFLRDRTAVGLIKLFLLFFGLLFIFLSLYDVDILGYNPPIEAHFWLLGGTCFCVAALMKIEKPASVSGFILVMAAFFIGVLISLFAIINWLDNRFLLHASAIVAGCLIGYGMRLLITIISSNVSLLFTIGNIPVSRDPSKRSLGPSQFWKVSIVSRDSMKDLSIRYDYDVQHAQLEIINKCLEKHAHSFSPSRELIFPQSGTPVEIHFIMRSYLREITKEEELGQHIWALCIGEEEPYDGPLDDDDKFKRSHHHLARELPGLFTAVGEYVFNHLKQDTDVDESWARMGTWLHHLIATDEAVTSTNLWYSSGLLDDDERRLQLPLHHLYEQLHSMYISSESNGDDDVYVIAADRLLDSLLDQTGKSPLYQVASSGLLCFTEQISGRRVDSFSKEKPSLKVDSPEKMKKYLKESKNELRELDKNMITSNFIQPSDELDDFLYSSPGTSMEQTPLEKFVRDYVNYLFGVGGEEFNEN